MDVEQIAEDHAEWYSKLCKRVYKEAWVHSRKHTLEEIQIIWDNNAPNEFEKRFKKLLKEGKK